MNLSINQHAITDVTGYYATFPSTIPLPRVRCSRVTHPFAGRRHLLLDPLPLDLHVLSLPLAFILSQDQTLHCIFYKSKLAPDALFVALFPDICVGLRFRSSQNQSLLRSSTFTRLALRKNDSQTCFLKETDARLKYIVSLQYSVLACTFLSVFSMNFLKLLPPCLSALAVKIPARFRTGLQRYALFLN